MPLLPIPAPVYPKPRAFVSPADIGRRQPHADRAARSMTRSRCIAMLTFIAAFLHHRQSFHNCNREFVPWP